MSYLNEVQGLNGISAKVVAASVSYAGKKLTTLELRYPRFIHSEFMTHRMFSRNASSSRAIPVTTYINQILTDPATPIHWGLNQAGMQAQDEQVDIDWATNWWNTACVSAAKLAGLASANKLHKQIANRVLEPFQFMTTLVSSTEWDNFFAQRISPDAQPEINELAVCMQEAMIGAVYSEDLWHLPYLTQEEGSFPILDKIKISVARCCRVSYDRHGIRKPLEDDIQRHDDLVESGHWSPFEHIACVLEDPTARSGNFVGWHQYRNILQEVNPFLKQEITNW